MMGLSTGVTPGCVLQCEIATVAMCVADKLMPMHAAMSSSLITAGLLQVDHLMTTKREYEQKSQAIRDVAQVMVRGFRDCRITRSSQATLQEAGVRAGEYAGAF